MTPERGKFISIHGIDGTGKTTASENVAESLKLHGQAAVNYDNYKEIEANRFSQKKENADKNGTLEERVIAYLESTMYHSDRITELLDKGYHVVKSRYLDDVIAHFTHLGYPKAKLQKLLKKFPMVQPDLKVVLTLDEEKRHERIAYRGVLDERDTQKKEEGTRLQYFEDYLLEAAQKAPEGSVLKIDTGKLNASEVARQIIEHVITEQHERAGL